jgi:hypothetical protein
MESLESSGLIQIANWIADSPAVMSPFTRFLYNHPDLGQPEQWRRDSGLTPEELVKFLELFSRESRSRAVDFHEQAHVAKMYFRFFARELQRQEVQHVMFEICPITGLDYVCYLAAKRLGIGTTMCLQSLMPGRFHFCHALDDFGRFDSVQARDEDLAIPPIDWGFNKHLFYMDRRGKHFPPRYGHKWPRLIREVWRHGLRASRRPLRMSGVIENFIQGRDFEVGYKALALAARNVDWVSDYVYFPLHLQPELTTSGLGGRYSDQLDALEDLSAMIPEGWWVYVKENPKQGCEQRGREFYRRLQTIRKVKYLQKDVDTYKLLEGCRFVATITGTVGWEAITGGKPCLVFGRPWYLTLPGVTAYSPGVTANDVLTNAPTQLEVEAAYRRIAAKTRRGVLDVLYAKIWPEYESTRNVRDIASFVTEVIAGDVSAACR